MLIMHRNLTANAKQCKHGLEGKILLLQTDITKSDLGATYVPKKLNEVVQLDLCEPFIHVERKKKDALVAVDVFYYWRSAYVCSSLLDTPIHFLI